MSAEPAARAARSAAAATWRIARFDPDRGALAATLGAAVLLGAALGLLYPAWQVAIEPAQVLAGLVRYPAGDPFGFYEQSLWTVWHQALAPLLAAGVPERALALGISAVVGALAFAALAVFALACGAPTPLAIAAPLLTWAFNPATWGFNYPILLIGYPHTYGMAGLSWIVLATGLLGTGRFGAGALLLGAAPAVHGSLGVWAAAIAGVAAVADWRALRPHLARAVGGGALGVALAAASLAVHWQGRPAPPAGIDPAATARALTAFLRHWDQHRAPVDLLQWRTVLFAIGIGLAIALLRRRAGAGRRLLLRVYLGCGLVGLGFSLLRAEVPLGALPNPIVVSMPTRLANVAMFAFVPLVAGALGAARDQPLARWLVAALVAAALLWFRAHWLLGVGLPAIGLAAIAVTAAPDAVRLPTAWARWTAGRAHRIDAGVALLAVAGFGVVLVQSVHSLPRRAERLRDPRDVRVYRAARGEPGLLLVAPGVELAQLRTRRPLVLDPNALDMLPYAPAGATAVAEICTTLYGVDFLAPPPTARPTGTLPPAPVRSAWEARSRATWIALARRFDFTEVLAPAGWRLDLPVAASDRRLALYRVPADPVASP